MIQHTILFSGFISALPQKEAMMAEPGQEGKQTREKERVSSTVFAISAPGLGCRFRGHDASDGVRQSLKGSSFPSNRGSRNYLGSEAKEANRN
jgi:hypothetical protein